MKIKFELGQRISHGPYYPMTCAERFNYKRDPEDFSAGIQTRPSEPVPIGLHGESFVIGLKRCIMSNYKYTPERRSQGYEDQYPEVEQASATGKFEECLICVRQLKPFKPYLVRKKDVVQ